MISTALSVLGIPAATQKPSIGNPSFRICCQRGNYLCESQRGMLGERNAKTDLERPLPLVDVERVKSETRAWTLELAHNLRDLGTQALFVVMATAREFDVIASIQDGSVESSLDSRGRHSRHHQGRLTEQPRERRVDVDFSILRLDETSSEGIRPACCPLELGGVVDLVSEPSASKNDSDATAFDSAGSDAADATEATGAKVDNVRRRRREGSGNGPVNREGKDLSTQLLEETALVGAEVAAVFGVVDRQAELFAFPEIGRNQLNNTGSARGEVFGVERGAYREKAKGEGGKALGEGNLHRKGLAKLVGAKICSHLALVFS
jgi:hypothetical protein